MLRRLLHGIGYALSPIIFRGAETPEVVAQRLRAAYRLVGVRIEDRSRSEDVERTVFECPYRNLGADRYGQKWVCHDILDRVDDGYVSYLAAHRDIEYRRPRDCREVDFCGNEAYCYSEVTTAE